MVTKWLKRMWWNVLGWLLRQGPRIMVIILMLGMGAVPRGLHLA